jgi:hypothetical protein
MNDPIPAIAAVAVIKSLSTPSNVSLGKGFYIIILAY